MIKSKLVSWGKTKQVESSVEVLNFSCDKNQLPNHTLPIGKLRSYGDSCLPVINGHALDITSMNRIISFDPKKNLIEVEAGITFEDLLLFLVPKGFFLPVTPGTKYITVGGAIANDVHGKNHHDDGNFGHFLESFILYRSDENEYYCSKEKNSDLFYSTIGGLGLTGIIKKATFNLKKIQSSQIIGETIKFNGLSEFIKINNESKNYLYTVAWLDCLSNPPRGIYIRGNHSTEDNILIPHSTKSILNVPFNFPNFVLNNLTIKIFNFLYFNKQLGKVKKFKSHYGPFFYPLDAILNWNRIYGKRGFYQYQCVLPIDKISEFESMLNLISKSGLGSFLSVLKTFGDKESLGHLSFPSEGFTLALDFANTGENLRELFTELNKIVIKNGGKIYPAKDFNMSESEFKKYYPKYNEFLKNKDNKLESSFSKRVNL